MYKGHLCICTFRRHLIFKTTNSALDIVVEVKITSNLVNTIRLERYRKELSVCHKL